MSISERIDQDLKDSMKARDADRTGLLRMLKSALKYAAIERGGADAPLSEADEVAVLRKQVKQRQDSVESFEKGGRPELAAKERAEMALLEIYLPKALSANEVEALVKEAIAEAGATGKAQMGAVMKLLQTKVAGRADGKSLSVEVARQLAS